MGCRSEVKVQRLARNAWLTGALTLGASAVVLTGVVVNAATGSPVNWLPSMNEHPLRWLAATIPVTVVSGLFGLWAQRRYDRTLAEVVPVAQRPESWVVDRPEKVREIARALCRRRSGSTIAVTTAVHGAGGFGKSTVARIVWADKRVLRRFDGRVFWVTLGRDVRRGALVEKINDLVKRIDPTKAQPITDVRQAADHLAAVLAEGPRRLLVLDDVWFEDQLAAFPVAGHSARLVTTRNPSLIGSDGVTVEVDRMSELQARAVLTADLPPLPAGLVDGLMVEADRWPLLLRLINKILVDQGRLRTDVAVAAGELLHRLREDGALQVDALTGATAQPLDVADPDQRRLAVAATIEASVGLLAETERERFAELAIFVEDEAIPVSLVASLWKATSDLDAVVARALCTRLGDLALLSVAATDGGGTVSLHDVVRDYLREGLGAIRLCEVNEVLIGAVAAGLPAAQPGVPDASGPETTAWWQLPETAFYLWDHLVEHLLAAGRANDADTVVADLRWITARLEHSGPNGPFADLTRVGSERATRLARIFGQTSHLLAPADPPHSLVDILYSRIAHDPHWGPQVASLAAERTRPALVSRWPLPDLPRANLRRTLAGHPRGVSAMAVASGRNWLATAGFHPNDAVRIWELATGAQVAELARLPRRATAIALAPDGSWLATTHFSGRRSGPVQVWDVTSGTKRTELFHRPGPVSAMLAAPDGTWLATAGEDGKVHIWDIGSGTRRATLTHESFDLPAIAVSPDGTWLATGSEFDGLVRIWDVATGAKRAELARCPGGVSAIAVAPDGTWLAAGDRQGMLGIWDVASGTQRAEMAAHSRGVSEIAVAPDGTWLASRGDVDRVVQIWDIASGAKTAEVAHRRGMVTAVTVAPDGTSLATGGRDGTVRIWDELTGAPHPDDSARHVGSMEHSIALAADGTWLATTGGGTVRIWDMPSGTQRAVLGSMFDLVSTIAAAPDSTWLATGSSRDGAVRIWDMVTGAQRAEVGRYIGRVTAIAVGPDGSWLATGHNADGTVRIWDVTGGGLRSELGGLSYDVSAIAMAPDGSWLAGCDELTVQIWDVITGTRRTELAQHRDRVTAIGAGPDGTWLATGTDEGRIQIWDIADGTPRAGFAGGVGTVLGIAAAPNGTRLAACGEVGVQIWDTAAETPIALIRTDASLRACAWTPDGSGVVAVGDAGVYHFELRGVSVAGRVSAVSGP
jgi:WD40 repeat protein